MLDQSIGHRHPPGPARLPYLDGWRGLSILAVLIGHFAPLPYVNAARMGVELFFVLSGRLMAQVLFFEKMPLWEFLRRRISRVWPGLLVFVVAVAVYKAAIGNPIPRSILLATATFTSNYINLPPIEAVDIQHLWSLCVEEWSYIALAIIAFLSRRVRLDYRISLALLITLTAANGLVLTLVGGLKYAFVYWRTDVRAASILIAALAFVFVRQSEHRPSQWLAPIAAILGAVLSLDIVPDTIKYTLGSTCFAVAIATLAFAHPIVLKTISMQPLRWLGIVSFSVYLWQQPMLHVAGYPAVARLAAAVLLGWLSFRLVEQPARRWLNRLGDKKTPPTAAAPSPSS